MKLITWNIQWGRGIDGRVDLARIVSHAREMADFDVLNVQEIADNFPGLAGNDSADQFAQLAALLPGYTAIPGYGVDLAGPGRRRRFGNMILTRLPVVSVRRHALPWPADPGRESMPRVAIEATLMLPLGPVRFTTTHLEYYSPVQRSAQAARLRDLHDEACGRALQPGFPTAKDGPFDNTAQTPSAILTADFNFPPENPAYDDIQKPLASGGPAYRDAWALVNGHRAHDPTFCVHDHRYAKEPYCCDFLYVSEDLAKRVRGIRVDLDTQVSDHQPVLLTFDDR
ncbi:MAG: endonuclease/exonuclease/phosphatase family protein [Betaproteobacteria bacterium]|nr:endonuclease/exonuclease/phosphatase family protein [Betaproteobacteria bacterium]